jgi:hexosaminidase
MLNTWTIINTINNHLKNNLLMRKIPAIAYLASILIMLTACGKVIKTDNNIAIIPRPVHTEAGNSVFRLTPKTKIIVLFKDNKLPYATKMLNDLLIPVFGKGLSVNGSNEIESNAINISFNQELAKEEYSLIISDDKVIISASTEQGVFYAMETIRQLIPVEAFNATHVKAIEMPTLQISDKPYFSYRGMMLDVSRHFYTTDEIKKTLDILALHKLNRFHWHLTDDQGWRIEIKKYPKLITIGSIRNETVIGRNTGKFDGTPYKGYYTQEEIKEIVEYAKERFITIIPEIELPGHASAALASYPELGCAGKDYKVQTQWGVFEQLFCPGKDSTFQFLEDVLTEVMDLFPSEYIHIGGDEAWKTEWHKCPYCQGLIKNEKLRSEEELQGYVTKRIEKFVNKHGRKIIGWDEILDGGVTPTATVMSWRGTKGGIEAARKGNNVIMTPTTYCYLDYYQSADTAKEPFAIGGFLPIEKVYSFDPLEQLTADEKHYIMGVQGNLWTEYITSFSNVEYMILPRLTAIAETGWSYDRKNYDNFKQRFARLAKLYDCLGYNYSKHILTDNQTK